MGIMHKLLKIFSNFKGLDERTSNITEESENASKAININFRKDGGICKRNGYHGKAISKGGKGNAFYYETDSSTGQVSETLVTADDNLHKKIQKSFTLTYNETTENYIAYYSIRAHTDNGILFEITEEMHSGTCADGTHTDFTTCSNAHDNKWTWTEPNVYTLPLGKGDESNLVKLSDLKTWITGTDSGENIAPPSGKFEVSTISDPTIPAAFLEKTSRTLIPTTSLTLNYDLWETIPTGGSALPPFKEAWALKANENLDNYSFSNLNEIMYIGTGFDDLKKYDGNRIYNAGMKKGPATEISGWAGGGLNPTYKSGTFMFTHEKSHWVDCNQSNVLADGSEGTPSSIMSSSDYVYWAFAPSHTTTGARWIKKLQWAPRFIQDTLVVTVTRTGVGLAANSSDPYVWRMTAKLKRQFWRWKTSSPGKYIDGNHPNWYGPFRTDTGQFNGSVGTANWREAPNTPWLSNGSSNLFFNDCHPNLTGTIWGESSFAGYVPGGVNDGGVNNDWSQSGPESNFTNSSLVQDLNINWKNVTVERVGGDHFAQGVFPTDSSGTQAHGFGNGNGDSVYRDFTEGTSTMQDVLTWFNSFGSCSKDTTELSHPDLNGGASLNDTGVAAHWGQASGGSTKAVVTSIILDTSNGLSGSDVITGIDTGTYEATGQITTGNGGQPYSYTPVAIPVSASTGNASQELSSTGPLYAPSQEEYCSVLKDNGEPYLDSDSCINVGKGVWVNTGDSSRGTCDDASYTTHDACIAANSVWTWHEGYTSAGNQYNEWRWKMNYMQKDAKGNLHSGEPGEPLKLTLSLDDKTRYSNSQDMLGTPQTLTPINEFSITAVGNKGLRHITMKLPSIANEEGFNSACGIVDLSINDYCTVTHGGTQDKPTCNSNDGIWIEVHDQGVVSSGGTNITYSTEGGNDYSANIPLKIEPEKHTFQVGDTAYFKDLHHSAVEEDSNNDKTVVSMTGTQVYREFKITAIGDNYITVTVTGNSADDTPIVDSNGNLKTDSRTFTIAADQPISNNLRIQLWRTKNLGSQFEGDPTYYLVEEIPMQNQLSGGVYYKDQFRDEDLGPSYEELVSQAHLTRHYPLPKAKYLAAVTNTLIHAGNPSSVGTLYRSEPGHPEIYSGLGSFFTVAADGGGAISGLGVLNKLLYVFQEKAISAVGGNISTSQIRIDVISNPTMGVGCTSHHTIKEVQGILYFLSEKGVYGIAPGTSPKEMSALIAPLIDKSKYNLKRAVAANWNSNDLYMVTLPALSTNVEGSSTLVYNTYRDAWTKWDNFDMTQGVAVGVSDIYFTSGDTPIIYKIQQTQDTTDFADHGHPILFEYVTNWEALGDATVPKRFLRLKAFSIDSSETFETDGFNLNVTTEKDYDITPLAELNFDFNQWAVLGWGDTSYDSVGWGDNISRNKYLKSKLSSPKTKSYRLTFKNEELNKNALLSGYELEIAAPYRPEIKE